MAGADHLGVKRQLQVMALQVDQLSTSAGRRGRHHVIHLAHPLGERGDRRIVGYVDSLSGDVVVAVSAGELALVSARHDDPRTFRLRQRRHRTRDPAAASDHHDCLVPQRVAHPYPLLRSACPQAVADRATGAKPGSQTGLPDPEYS
jgi:hypothetical protein